ncbi:hypothetical protein Tco_0552171, partial [Tanacetum coccineum]
ECGASESTSVYVSSLHSQHICSYAHMLVKCFAAVPISIPSGRILIVPAGRYVVPADSTWLTPSLDETRDIWLAVKARFGGLHKGYDRFQKILRSNLNQLQAKPDNEDYNIKSLEPCLLLSTGGSSYNIKSTSAAPSHVQPLLAQLVKTGFGELDKYQMANVQCYLIELTDFAKKAGRKTNFKQQELQCTGTKVESNARYSAFKIKELEQDKPADPKALLSVDSMVNWSDHEESADENASQVYGMIAGPVKEAHERSDNVTFPAGSVNMPAPIHAGRQPGPAPVYAGTPDSCYGRLLKILLKNKDLGSVDIGVFRSNVSFTGSYLLTTSYW